MTEPRVIPLVSIVIAAWNARDYCVRCVSSLLSAGYGDPHFEIVVVDNGSTDGTVEAIERLHPQVLVLRNASNIGVAPGRNTGIRRSTGEFILLLESDTAVPPGAIESLVAAMKDPVVGVVGPRLVGPGGNLQYTCRQFPTLVGKLGRRLPVGFLSRRAQAEEFRAWDHTSRREVDYVIGACQLVRQAVFDDIGLLDERIFYGPEDVDLCLRAQLAGWRVVYEPEAEIVHAERRITLRWRPTRMQLVHARGLAYFFLKHRYLLSSARLRQAIEGVRAAQPAIPRA